MSTSKTFCYNAFTGLDIGTYGRIRPCCKFDIDHIPVFNIANGISSYRNSTWLKQLQYEFIQGKRPAGCNRCWVEEDAGIESRRQMDYKRHQHRLDKLTLKEKDFIIVGVAFNNLCNLACRICGPWASSTWMAEQKKQDPSLSTKPSTWHKMGNNLQDLYEYSQNASLLEIVGGEPFLSDFPEHLDFLQKFVDSGNAKNIILHYTTNGTIFPAQEYRDIWNNFKEVEIQLSIDDIEERFEYNRWPAKWPEVYNNIKSFQFYADSHDNINITTAYTVSAFTIGYASQFTEWCRQQELSEPWFGLVNKHAYYHPGILDNDIKNNIRKTLLASESEKVRNLAAYLDSKKSDMPAFMQEVQRLDAHRKQNFQETFPELVPVCK